MKRLLSKRKTTAPRNADQVFAFVSYRPIGVAACGGVQRQVQGS